MKASYSLENNSLVIQPVLQKFTEYPPANSVNKTTAPVFAGENTNAIYYSRLGEAYTPNAFRNLSLKYVLEGEVLYKNGVRTVGVLGNNVLLACKEPFVSGTIGSTVLTSTICIDIRTEYLADALAVLSGINGEDPDNNNRVKFADSFFSEQLIPLAELPFANVLDELKEKIIAQQLSVINTEWFLQLAGEIARYQLGNFIAFDRLSAYRMSTRKEILRRVLLGRKFMDENFLARPDISEVAAFSNLSLFHFLRSFRQATGITPYQYMIEKRLNHAAQLLRQPDLSFSEIAGLCKFPDLFTFSKAFKKKFGISPTLYLRQSA